MTRPNRAPGRKPRAKRPPISEAAFRIQLDGADGAAPFFEQIRFFIREGVADGTFPAGVRLPPERRLAKSLGVSRSTVMRAYQELVAEGLARATPSRGTVVAPLEEVRDRVSGGPADWAIGLPALAALGPDTGLLREIVAAGGREGVISFASAAPPLDLMPLADIGQCIDEVMNDLGPRLLGYGPVEGLPQLRDVITERMRESGSFKSGDSVVVLSGSTQGLALTARVFIEPGEEVVVESPTYLGVIQSLELAGARLIGVPIDSDGIKTAPLAEVLARRRIRLMVLQPNFHNPTGVCLSPDRREQVLWLARRYGVPILEDDAYGALYHRAAPPDSLKRMDRHGLVLYLSSFSKTLAPGLRVAWMCGAEPVMSRIGVAKQFSDLNTNSIGQAVVARMMSTGRYDANLSRLREASDTRMRLLLGELDRLPEIFGRDLDPTGGLHVWCRLNVGDAQTAVAAAARGGVAMIGGTAFYPRASSHGGGAHHVRLSLPVSGADSIKTGIRRLGEALAHLPARGAQTAGRPMAVVV